METRTPEKPAQYAHKVFTPSGKRLKKIDTVFANYSDPEEMRRSLINHDGYASNIVVICGRKRAPKSKQP